MKSAERPWLLTPAEELPLILRAQQGDEPAKLALLRSQERLIRALVRRQPAYMPGMDEEDLLQYGVLGFLKAIDHYDPTRRAAGAPDRPLRLITMAKWWIRSEVGLAVEQGMFAIRPPRGQRTQPHPVVSLSDLIQGLGGESELVRREDVIPDPIQFEARALSRQRLADLFAEMPDPRWPALIVGRFGLDGREPLAYDVLGQRSGVSRDTARRLIGRASEWLREHLALS